MADQKIIRKTYEAVETKAAEGEDRTLIVTISTASPDRSKDVVVPSGMESDNYLRNPVVAAFHRYDQPAIGKTVDLQQTENGVVAKVQFLPKGIYPLADQLYEMYKAGFMNAWSIGFIPKERTELDPQNFTGGNRFDKWELLEYSAVLVPDNPEALTMLRSKGIDEKTIEAAQHIDEEADPKEVVKEIAEASKKTEELEQKTEENDHLSYVGEHGTPVPPGYVYNTKTKELEKEAKFDAYLEGEAKANERITALEKEIADLKTQLAAKDTEEKTVDAPTEHPTLVPVMKALKQADKFIGIALRDYKKSQPQEN